MVLFRFGFEDSAALCGRRKPNRAQETRPNVVVHRNQTFHPTFDVWWEDRNTEIEGWDTLSRRCGVIRISIDKPFVHAEEEEEEELDSSVGRLEKP